VKQIACLALTKVSQSNRNFGPASFTIRFWNFFHLIAMTGVNNSVRTGWPRGVTQPTASTVNSFPKNPSLTLNRQVNLYPLTNYTFGTKDPLVKFSLCVF
jgi:hypothetical protein